VEKRIKGLHEKISASSQPSVVWLCDVSDEKTNRKIDGTIMKAEPVGIALKRFNCYRVDVLNLPDGDVKEKLVRETPGFYFFDPAGELIKSIDGKRATSLSTFSKLMEYTWDKSFTMRLRKFQKEMKNVLDALDRYDVKKQGVDRDKAKLEERPRPSLKRKVEKEEAELEEMKKEVEAQEKELIESCTLSEDYLPKQDEE
jgi:hypothetical protein